MWGRVQVTRKAHNLGHYVGSNPTLATKDSCSVMVSIQACHVCGWSSNLPRVAYALVAQLVERSPCKRQVRSSSLLFSSLVRKFLYIFNCRSWNNRENKNKCTHPLVAQSGLEQLVYIQKVVGSNPIRRTIISVGKKQVLYRRNLAKICHWSWHDPDYICLRSSIGRTSPF